MTRTKTRALRSLQDEAVGWLVRVQSDAATAEDWIALTAWLETSPRHAEAFDRAERLSADIANQSDTISARLEAQPVPSSMAMMRSLPRRWVLTGGLAAAAAIAVVTGPSLYERYAGAPTTYRTAPGEQRDVVLSDGTRVRLDAASTMTVRLGWGRRRVWLAQAQASFDVAKDAGRPFAIDVGDQRVRVVGTEFNVRHFDGEVRVTVRRGVVEVSQPTRGEAVMARLTAGDEMAHAEGGASSVIRRVAPDAAFAWRQGRLVCQDELLSQIVADLNRRYATPVRVTGAASTKRFSGVLELGDEATLVRRLAGYLSLSVRRTNHEFILN